MSSFKRHWLYTFVGLVVLLCVALGTFLVWRANQTVETKTVYAMPKPNPERAEILERALRPPKRAYTAKVGSDATTTGSTTDESLETDSGDSLNKESEFEDADLDLMLGIPDEETVEEKGDFPLVPDGFPSNLSPVWFTPGYKKGDEPEYESIYRVLIKLWNQGDHRFSAGAFSDGKVYPLYPDVLYVEWSETTIDDVEGNPMPVRYISGTLGTDPRDFEFEINLLDFATGEWKSHYPEIQFVDTNSAGYDPYTFLTDND